LRGEGGGWKKTTEKLIAGPEDLEFFRSNRKHAGGATKTEKLTVGSLRIPEDGR
jgi:hypothetical protein